MILSDFICWLCWTRACFQHFISMPCCKSNKSYVVRSISALIIRFEMNREIIISFYIFKEFFLFQSKNKEETKKMKITLRMQSKRTLYHQFFATHFIFLNLLLLRENGNNVNKYKWNNRILNYTQRTSLHFSLELNSTMYHCILNTEWLGIGK